MIAEYDGSDTLLRKFIYGPGIDEPICMIDVDGETQTRYYYHYDGLGSVVAISDTSGNLVEKYVYNVFGSFTIYDANDTHLSESSVGNPYYFTGRRYDSETGLYYYRARYYNPELGRFMQTDPIGYTDGINWYAYCGNNPWNSVDPMGLCKDKPWYKQSWEAVGGFGIGLLEFVYDTEMALIHPIDTASSIWDGMYDMGSRFDQTMYDIGANPGMLSDLVSDIKDLGGQILFEEIDNATKDPVEWGRGVGYFTGGTEASVLVGKGLSEVGKYEITMGLSTKNTTGPWLRISKGGKNVFGADYGPFKLNGEMVNKPHLHYGSTKSQFKKHRPWQGGWKYK